MTRTFLLCLTLLVSIATGFAQDKLKVLLIDGQNNHKWQATTPVLKDALDISGRFTVEVSTTPPKKAPKEDWSKWNPDFSKYDVVLSNYNGEEWPETAKSAFVDYVKNGGGFVVVHAADNSFPRWKEYNEMIGVGGWGGRNEKSGPKLYFIKGKLIRDTSPGRGGSHGKQHEFHVDNRMPDHPIMKGIPEKWLHAKDELYDSLRGPAENLEVLASSLSDKTNKHEPMAMTIRYGKGRVFHTPMGHADYSMKCVGFWTILQRGTEWAATEKVTIPVPEKFNSKDAVLVPSKYTK